MNDIKLYEFRGREVRTVIVDGEPWFVAADVAAVLGYGHTPSMVRRMDDDEKGVREVHTLGGRQNVTANSAATATRERRHDGRSGARRTWGDCRGSGSAARAASYGWLLIHEGT